MVKEALDWVAYVGAALASVLLVLALVGCKPAVVYQEVRVPVPVPCPIPPDVARPELPIFKVGMGATPQDIVRAYAVSVQLLIAYAERLELILEGYKKPDLAKKPEKP